MVRLSWDDPGERKYETGVDRGVFYPSEGPGAAWTGLISVTESPSGAEATAVYADDIKYLNLVSAEEFSATVEAYMWPDSFQFSDGWYQDIPGVLVGQQRRHSFGMSYRTRIGNDTQAADYGYKLHLIYNALAAPSEKAYSTINDTPEAVSFSWELTTNPVFVSGLKPTSIITLDSTKISPMALKMIEDRLYGNSQRDAYLPSPDEVIGIVQAMSRDPFEPAPSYNQPTVSVAALPLGNVSTVAGATLFREKRIGQAEVTVARGPIGDLDVQKSTRYNYIGMVSGQGFIALPEYYASSKFKAGGDSQFAYQLMSIDFMTDAEWVEVKVHAPVANPHLGLIMVDGQPLTSTLDTTFYTATAGSTYGVKLTFPDARTRRITIYGLNATQGRFAGLSAPAGRSIWKPVTPKIQRIAFLGDSYTSGSGAAPTGASTVQTYMWRLGLLMRGTELINYGIGSTGFEAIGSGTAASRFSGRVDEILTMNPDALIIAGGRNDSASGTMQQTIEDLISSLRYIPRIYLIPTAIDTSAVRESMRLAALAQGAHYIDIPINDIPKAADNVHPTYAGHQQLADRAFAKISTIL